MLLYSKISIKGKCLPGDIANVKRKIINYCSLHYQGKITVEKRVFFSWTEVQMVIILGMPYLYMPYL